MIGDLGWQELLIILVIVALLFGAGRVADMGGALGRGIREFREGASGGTSKPEPEVAASASDSLFALKQLHDSGVMNDSEYEAKRQELVAKL
jgi:sec-independent protein translocase protein TatA